MTRAYLGLGANLGDRRAAIASAIEALDWGGTRVVAKSRLYETDPVGGPPDQPRFLNAVVAVETSLDPRALLDRCTAVEAALGRARNDAVRWGPRPLDIDVLLFGDVVVDEPDLQIPHPRIAERRFVLVPLLEIDPEVIVPGRGSARALLEALEAREGAAGVHPVG